MFETEKLLENACAVGASPVSFSRKQSIKLVGAFFNTISVESRPERRRWYNGQVPWLYALHTPCWTKSLLICG